MVRQAVTGVVGSVQVLRVGHGLAVPFLEHLGSQQLGGRNGTQEHGSKHGSGGG